MSRILNDLILLIFIKISLTLSLCINGKNHCSRCNPITKLCVKCDKDIYSPDKIGGCENAKKCLLGRNQCLECNEFGDLCKKCIDGFFPDENGGCSYSDNCEISYEGNCIKCKENFILIGLDNNFYEGIKLCKSLVIGDLKNCEIINTERGYCEQCKEGFFLNSGDNKCTNIENCKESSFDVCTKCNNGYYLDKKENKCKFQDEIFGHCIQTLDGKTCDLCEEDYYFDEDNKCTAINYCSKSNSNYRCEKCISGYFLAGYGTVCTQEENCFIGNKDIGICNQCKENYYLDYKDGKCKSNQDNNEFKFCLQADEGKCTKCINNYKLGLDNKCSSTFNCEEADNGICIQCLENFYLGLDNRCSKTEKCIYSNDNTCLECDNNYYFNRANGTCVLDEGKFKNCKISNYAKLYCEECKRDYYLNKTDNLCYSNLDKNGKFYKCSKTDDLAEFCDMCIEGYYLGEKDKKCNINYGCLLSEDENRCAECEEYYCLDKKTGKCVDNEEIYEEEKKFYYKCNITNEEGTACEICDDGYILKSNGICKEEAHCIEKDEKGNCKKCKYLENDDFYFSFCLNQYFGCVEIYGNDKCIECNNNLDFYNCTKCEEGYKINEYGSCE